MQDAKIQMQEPFRTSFRGSSWTSSLSVYYLLPQSIAMSYSQIFDRFASRAMLEDIRSSALPSIH